MSPAQIVLFSIKASVILSVFALGLQSTFKDTFYLFQNPRKLIRAFTSIYVAVPITAGAIIFIFDEIHPAAKIAIFALSVSPIPPLLPKKQLKTGTNISYIIALLVTMSLLAIIAIPVLVQLFSLVFERDGGIRPIIVAKVVLSVILIPLLTGLTFRNIFPKLAEKIAQPIISIGSIFLILASLFIIYSAFPQIMSLVGNGTILAILLFILIAFAIGNIFGGADLEEKTALTLSTVCRHPGMALAIAEVNFPQQKLSLAAVILYLLISQIIMTMYIKIRQRSTKII